MTNEQHIDNLNKLKSFHNGSYGESINAAVKALKELKTGHWIPVSERFPNKNGRYLVTVKQGYITFGAWVDVAENWAQVTAWMPLPELYKAEREGKNDRNNRKTL